MSTGAAATRRSRWYVTAFFSTFIVITLVIYADPGTATSRFNERMLGTLLGVAIAYCFGLLVPAVIARARMSGRAR